MTNHLADLYDAIDEATALPVNFPDHAVHRIFALTGDVPSKYVDAGLTIEDDQTLSGLVVVYTDRLVVQAQLDHARMVDERSIEGRTATVGVVAAARSSLRRLSIETPSERPVNHDGDWSREHSDTWRSGCEVTLDYGALKTFDLPLKDPRQSTRKALAALVPSLVEDLAKP